jgi:hypothetical protein
MGKIIAVGSSAGQGTVTSSNLPIASAIVNNDEALIATNNSNLVTTITAVTDFVSEHTGAVDITFDVEDSGGVTEYYFADDITNGATLYWNAFRFRLGFDTGSAFVVSNAGDQLDFDVDPFLPGNNPPPTFTWPAEGAIPPTVTRPTGNDLCWATGTGAGAPIAAAVSSTNTVTFSMDVPDWNAFFPASAKLTDGPPIQYRFTLRQVAYATPPGGAAAARFSYAFAA